MAFNIYHLWFFFFKKIHYFLFLIFFFTPAPVLDNQLYLQMNFQIYFWLIKGGWNWQRAFIKYTFRQVYIQLSAFFRSVGCGLSVLRGTRRLCAIGHYSSDSRQRRGIDKGLLKDSDDIFIIERTGKLPVFFIIWGFRFAPEGEGGFECAFKVEL